MLNKKLNKNSVIFTILILLLIGSFTYIFLQEYSSWKFKKEAMIYQQGAQYGYEQTVKFLYEQVLSCQQIPLTVQNETINIIAVECLVENQEKK
jgi:hypothetical protein